MKCLDVDPLIVGFGDAHNHKYLVYARCGLTRGSGLFVGLETGTHGQCKDHRADDTGRNVLQRVHGDPPDKSCLRLLIAQL